MARQLGWFHGRIHDFLYRWYSHTGTNDIEELFPHRGLTHRRMHYSTSRKQPMPICGGAIESAVRRVINL